MTRFLDSKTSQNASYTNSIATPITLINTPQMIAQQTLDLSGGSANLTRVAFSRVVAIQLPLLPVATTITVSVFRGLTSTDVMVFSASQNLDINILGPHFISFTGSDYNASNIADAAYSVFVQSSAVGAIRVGPESINFTAVSDV